MNKILALLRRHYKFVVWASDLQPGREYCVVRSGGYIRDIIEPDTVLKFISQGSALNHFKQGDEDIVISDFDLDDLTLLEIDD